MTSIRIGQGFDIHPFSEDSGRALVLGGVTIEGTPGLAGHSDADVVAHAVADALLGAAGLGDLGGHFPASDPEWAGADSIELLLRVTGMLSDADWRVVNADCTVICEWPKLGGHVGAMSDKLSRTVGAPVTVSVKRAEGMGSIGRGDGIACLVAGLITTAAHGEIDGEPHSATHGIAAGEKEKR